jgi:DNA polymerase-1
MTTRRSCGPGEPVLCLVDGTALVYRSHYAFIRRPLVNSSGENVSAVYGFASSLIKLLDELAPSHMVVAFDRPEPTFRHEAYEDYKATREPMPDELVDQLTAIHELVEAFGIHIVEEPGYEADDLIGTLAVAAREEGLRSVIVSGDKDFFQLVDDTITVLDSGKNVEYTIEGVEEKFGVPPSQVVEVLGLMGDASDNVPGVPGVGKKTAIDLIARFGSVEGVLEHIDEISGAKRKQNLREFSEQAMMSRDLVTIDLAAPVAFNEGELARRPIDAERVGAFLREYEFPSLLKLVVTEQSPDTSGYSVVTSKKRLAGLVAALERSRGFVIDLETTSLDPHSAEIVGVSVALEEGEAFYIPVGHTAGRSLPRDFVMDSLTPALTNEDVPKYGQNIKFDYKVLLTHGIELAPLAFDTMIASYLLDPGRRQHGLTALALEHLGVRMTPIESLIGKGGEQLSFADVGVNDASDYSCADADVTIRLTHLLSESIREEGLDVLLTDVEMPLVRVLAGMELTGVELDVSFLSSLAADFGREIEGLRERVCDLAGVEFNLDSPKQVGSVLFERLELPRGRRTKTGYSTDISVLERLRDDHEVPALILEYRQLRKLQTGYLEALPKLVNQVTGRVHTSFNQTVAATGRLSSSNPNLQNIPIRTELGRQIRRAFVAGEGKLLLSADYSQVELRIMAHLSGDATLVEAFKNGKDVHRSTASLIFGVSEDDVSSAQRESAKTVNFGIMYGMGRFGLARRLGVGNDEAADFIQRYFQTYPGVREYTERVIAEAEDSGYASTMLGRRRPITGLASDNARVRGMAERVAVNTPIQGSAADLIKLAMLGVDRRIRSDGLPCRMVLQVHDELVFEIPEDRLDDVSAAVREEMESPEGIELNVPVVTNLASGPDWFEAHP